MEARGCKSPKLFSTALNRLRIVMRTGGCSSLATHCSMHCCVKTRARWIAGSPAVVRRLGRRCTRGPGSRRRRGNCPPPPSIGMRSSRNATAGRQRPAPVTRAFLPTWGGSARRPNVFDKHCAAAGVRFYPRVTLLDRIWRESPAFARLASRSSVEHHRHRRAGAACAVLPRWGERRVLQRAVRPIPPGNSRSRERPIASNLALRSC